MKQKTKRIAILIGFCIVALTTTTAVVTAMQISLDAPASLPSDI